MIHHSKSLSVSRFFFLSLISYLLVLFLSPCNQNKALSQAIKTQTRLTSEGLKQKDNKPNIQNCQPKIKLFPCQIKQKNTNINLNNKVTDTIKPLINFLNRSYFSKTPIGDIIPNLTLEQSYLIQENFVQSLIPQLGNPVGYKVGLTNAIAQQRLQINHSVRGILLEKILLKNGATVEADFGAVPRLEGDLIVRVGSDKINKAKTSEDIIQSLDAVIPFVELPDLMFEKGVKLTGAKLVAVNVGARLGIVGKPIALTNKKAWQTQLSQIRVAIKDSTGKELGTGSSDSLLNDPLNVVLWLKNELELQGKTLKKGDLISLGSMTPFIEIPTGETVTATYQGLKKDQLTTISVTFTD